MKLLSNIQTKPETLLVYRSSRVVTFLKVLSLYFLLTINNVYAAQVIIGWDQSNESDIAGYKIYYGSSSRNYSENVTITSGDATACTISDLIEGQTYYFAATSYNSSLVESDYSAEISYTISPAATTSTVIETTTISDSVTTTSTAIEPATTSEPETTSILTTSSTSTTISVSRGGHGSGGSCTSTTTIAAASSTTIMPAFTTTTIPASTTTIVPSYTTTVPADTPTTVFDNECSIKSVKSTGLPLKSGLLNPRLRRIVITGINSNWNDSSELTIDAINLIITMRVEHDKITALILIPSQQSGFQPGVKDVSVVTGSNICISTLEIE